MSDESNRRGTIAHEVAIRMGFAGMSREEAIRQAEVLHEAEALNPVRSLGNVDAYKQGMIDLLVCLASSGAFHDGRNMLDRIQGRFALNFDPSRTKRSKCGCRGRMRCSRPDCENAK